MKMKASPPDAQERKIENRQIFILLDPVGYNIPKVGRSRRLDVGIYWII